MVEEAYVSFETAKLLREKGFDERCKQFYNKEGELKHHKLVLDGNNSEHNPFIELEPTYFSVPIQQMAMRWLREIYNLHIVVSCSAISGWNFQILDIKEAVKYSCQKAVKIIAVPENTNYNSYEKACETAIIYCLENLILYDTET